MSERVPGKGETDAEKRERLGLKIVQIAVDAEGRLYALTNGGQLAYTTLNGNSLHPDHWTTVDLPMPGENLFDSAGELYPPKRPVE